MYILFFCGSLFFFTHFFSDTLQFSFMEFVRRSGNIIYHRYIQKGFTIIFFRSQEYHFLLTTP